ncbi:MAG TPA: 4Fe-4S double cluster binding domain-containing protein [Longilinea sp.]|nr:4Fe-4S double cluster binding domain-containing protein [Longilinea sp.]
MSEQDPNAGLIDSNGSVIAYRYRTVSVTHLPELQETIGGLRRDGLLSDAPTFQEYIREMRFALADDFQEAQSIIIVAIANPPLAVNLHYNGKIVSTHLPSGYFDPGVSFDELRNEVEKNIIKEPGHRIERPGIPFHLKLLAVRSGLARYGRNNISYVEGMGSFIMLRCFVTDYKFTEDHWQELGMMARCEGCSLCQKLCPGGAIRSDRFVIDVSRCVTLYNEVEGDFPAWIPAGAHNAILGCMKCQAACPGNREAIQHFIPVEDITTEETGEFISGAPGEKAIQSVSEKLRMPWLVGSQEVVDVICRNIKVLTLTGASD